MNDGVDARLLMVSHCLLNPYSQVKGRRTPKEAARFAISAAVQAGVGVVQMPCPEFTYEGPNRWAKSYAQYDTTYFRNHCAALVEPVVEQLREYVADGTQVLGVIGVMGSPSCGAYMVGTADGWGGCFDDGPEGQPWRPPPGGKVTGRGVYLQAVSDALEAEGWEIPVLAVPPDKAGPEVLERFRAGVELMLAGELDASVDDGRGAEPDAGESDPDAGDAEDWAEGEGS